MATNVILPKQGLQMTEGLITRWLYQEGDRVMQGQPLFEMETDKTTVAVDAPADGILLKIVRGEFETVPVADVVAVIGEAGEDAKPAPHQDQPKPEVIKVALTELEPMIAEPLRPQEIAAHTCVFATPRAKTTASDAGVDYKGIVGSGPEGLVIERDVLCHKPKEKLAQTENGLVVELTPMRRAIWDNMMASVHGMAQAHHRVHADMTEAARLRSTYKKAGQSVSYNDIVMLALCRALHEYPELNSSVTGNTIVKHDAVHMGLAVALDAGLIVPTIFDAHRMTLRELHEATTTLADRARKGALKPEEYLGGTFTLTNLGMYGIDEFDAIINPPQAGILAVGRIVDTPIVRDGQITVRAMAWLTLTYDHRIVDGAPAAKFLSRVTALLENPVLMI